MDDEVPVMLAEEQGATEQELKDSEPATIAYQTAWEVQRDGNLRKKIASEVKRLEPVEAE